MTHRARQTADRPLELEFLEGRDLLACGLVGPQTICSPHPDVVSPPPTSAIERPEAPDRPERSDPPPVVQQGRQQALPVFVPVPRENNLGQPLSPPIADVPLPTVGLAGVRPAVAVENATAAVVELLTRATGDTLRFAAGLNVSSAIRSQEATNTVLLTTALLLDQPRAPGQPLPGSLHFTPAVEPAGEPFPAHPGSLDPSPPGWRVPGTSGEGAQHLSQSPLPQLLIPGFGLLSPLQPFGARNLEQSLSEFRKGVDALFSHWANKEPGGHNWLPWAAATAIIGATGEVGRRLLARRQAKDELAGGPGLFPGTLPEGGHE